VCSKADVSQHNPPNDTKNNKKDMLRKGGSCLESVESVLREEKKFAVGRICGKTGFKAGVKK